MNGSYLKVFTTIVLRLLKHLIIGYGMVISVSTHGLAQGFKVIVRI